MAESNLFQEANRQLTICNACRYCEGLCPVFRAIELRRSFTTDDVRYLSNLCHDCRSCFQACMYTEPHQFALNIPKIMSEARVDSYEHWSWPKFMSRSFSKPQRGLLLGWLAAAVVYIAALIFIPWGRLLVAHVGRGSFYRVVPYMAMVLPALLLFFYGAAIWVQGALRFWNDSDGSWREGIDRGRSLLRSLGDALALRYLGGGGPGCTYPTDAPSSVRRIFHSFVFWGFLFDFASTTLAFFYQDVGHRLPPYPLWSAPVVCGSIGGVGLVVGTAGLLWFKIQSDRSLSATKSYGLDYAFLVFLGLTGLTGMLTLALRSTPAMGTILVVHLGMVAALFITAPYGKFVHFVYRSLALIRYHVEGEQMESQGGHP
jgi:citrate/tricarballylate utilization protein